MAVVVAKRPPEKELIPRRLKELSEPGTNPKFKYLFYLLSSCRTS